MTVSLMRFFWRMPKAHPTAATVISGILGAVLFIEGIVLSSTTTSTEQTNVAAGILVCIFGLLTMGLAAYGSSARYFLFIAEHYTCGRVKLILNLQQRLQIQM